jgi:AcrR family transcriptional regulator
VCEPVELIAAAAQGGPGPLQLVTRLLISTGQIAAQEAGRWSAGCAPVSVGYNQSCHLMSTLMINGFDGKPGKGQRAAAVTWLWPGNMAAGVLGATAGGAGMAEPVSAPVSAASAPRASRLDRRKARTRQALIDAAVRLIGEGRGDRASIQEITEAADIGFGSFYNHFDSKEQLFQTASEEVLERWGQMIDRASAGISDQAERFAVGMRISGRLGWTHPDVAGFLTGAGLDVLDIPVGLAPRALRDIQAGQDAGRFTVPDAEIALSAVAGGLLGLLRQCQRKPERVSEASVDQLAEAVLRLLGVPASEAARLVTLPLPPTGTWLHSRPGKKPCPVSDRIASRG